MENIYTKTEGGGVKVAILTPGLHWLQRRYGSLGRHHWQAHGLPKAITDLVALGLSFLVIAHNQLVIFNSQQKYTKERC